MTPTHISVAIVMVAVTAVLFLWFQRSLAAGSARRMTQLLTRIGLVHPSGTLDSQDILPSPLEREGLF